MLQVMLKAMILMFIQIFQIVRTASKTIALFNLSVNYRINTGYISWKLNYLTFSKNKIKFIKPFMSAFHCYYKNYYNKWIVK
jgi:hypothetical protein